MDDRKIREKYGGKLPKAINRAIRAEIPGGNAALDKLTQLAGAARHSGWKDRQGNPTAEAAEYFKHKRMVVDRMDSEVRKRWGVPPGEEHIESAARKAGPRKTRPPVKTVKRVAKPERSAGPPKAQRKGRVNFKSDR